MATPCHTPVFIDLFPSQNQQTLTNCRNRQNKRQNESSFTKVMCQIKFKKSHLQFGQSKKL
jgi:hypothetical protein